MASATVDEELIRKLAELARLELRDEDITLYRGQLEAILSSLAVLEELDLDDVPPTRHGGSAEDALRDDEPRAPSPRETVLENAPDPFAGHFRVPRVL